MSGLRFTGFPPEAFDFYERLAADNTKAFWTEHKSVYDDAVKAPLNALTEELADRFGEFRLFRPHRDVRFSKDKSPYKLQQGAVTEGEGGEIYYVALSAEGLVAGVGYYGMARDQLERFRHAVADDATGPSLRSAVDAVAASGMDTLSMGALKTAPRGFPRDHPRVELLRMKGLAMARSWPPRKWMAGREPVRRVPAAWEEAAPVTEWLNSHVGPSDLPPDEWG